MLEDSTQKFFDLISSITQHVDYKNFPHVSEKIKKAAENGDIFSIHRQYPFLTDMFFHVIIAEFKAQSNWLDWLWINDVEQIPEEDLKKILSAKDNSDFEYKSLLEMIASCANELSIQDEKSIEEQLEVAFLKNLDEMKKISEETEPDYINNHISLAKLQLKYIKPEKRKEYLKQYIDVLKKIRDLKSVKNSEKIS